MSCHDWYPQYAVGNVAQMEYNDKLKEFTGIRAWEKCPDNCTFLSVCSGGCRIMAAAQHGNLEDIYCEKKSIVKMAPELIRMDYARLRKMNETTTAAS